MVLCSDQRQETGLTVIYAISKLGESPSLSLLSAGISAVSKILASFNMNYILKCYFSANIPDLDNCGNRVKWMLKYLGLSVRCGLCKVTRR